MPKFEMLPIELRGARTHNLKGVDLTLAPGQLVVLTGVSGAGKSSLALDTLYAEGQRRFVESFSPYARQFLERLERPPMERLEPVAAGIAVDRRAPVKSSRSTVATMADIEPYLSALFTREAMPVCPEHDAEGVFMDESTAVGRALSMARGERAVITYPLAVRGVEHYLEVRDHLCQDGYRRLWLEGEARDIDGVRPSEALAHSALHVVVDRVKLDPSERKRLLDSFGRAFARSEGSAHVFAATREIPLRRGISCPECARELAPARAGLFSYESPLGACPQCRGFGRTIGIDWHKVVPDPTKTLKGRAIRPWAGKSTSWERTELGKLCRRHEVPMDVPWQDLGPQQQALVLEGDGHWNEGLFPGVRGWFQWLETRTYKMHVRVLLARYRSYDPCSACDGRRLNDHALSYRLAGADIASWHAMEISVLLREIERVTARSGQGELVRKEIASRLEYLNRVGLGYLTLDRQARTLSGGEAQRVTLTAALGTTLCNALFVLDEPTVGLHPSDIPPLVDALRELSRRNNSVVVVEHDPALIREADRVVEVGPGAGDAGGTVVFDGSPDEVAACGGATSRALQRHPHTKRPRAARAHLTVVSARANNLRDVTVKVPLGIVCAITGPSGSGKSTLAEDVLYRGLGRRLGVRDLELAGEHDAIDAADSVRRVVLVDQAPLGRTSRGNAGTYTKAWDAIRAAYAGEPEARAQGLTPSHFSFNVEGGRCDACAGEGHETVEMQFLADVTLTCPVCRGMRFKEAVLTVQHRGRSIAQILDSTVDDVLELYADSTPVLRALGPVHKLGLGYLRLGQPLSTLSGGEAQRLKLSRALAENNEGTLYVLDEPSAGLHADEVRSVLDALDALVASGGSVVVVDHDVQVIAAADWVIDLGPGAGRNGGEVVFEGTPRQLEKRDTLTGLALAEQVRSKGTADESTPSAHHGLLVENAREHNLKDLCVDIPHRALTVVTGPSGSGKSTLAFDVVFAEGQRRFLETLTPYARQFLPTLPRPDVDSVSGVPPSIALEQRTTRAGSKSTVATVTEVAHYLRLLFAKLGTPHCPDHEQPIATTQASTLFEMARKRRGKVSLLAPVVRARKGLYYDVFTAAARDGIGLAYCDGELVSTDVPPRLKRNQEHDIDLVIARGITAQRLEDADLSRALRWGQGALKLRDARGRETLLSLSQACPECGLSVPELDPRWFSFNTAQGRCESCNGDGVVATKPRRRRSKKSRKPAAPALPGVCPDCGGTRLSPIPRSVRLFGKTFPQVVSAAVADALALVRGFKWVGDAATIGAPIVTELAARLQFLERVGLDYLTLDRAANTLSGGEMQRLRLAAQLGAGLTGALYVLDEPTIGLHPRDTGRLLGNLRDLVDLGSTVVVVEHDADTIRAADYLVDLGPEGGTRGGEVVAAGAPCDVLEMTHSPTARALSHEPALRKARPVTRSHPMLRLRGAAAHNLRGVDVDFPAGRLTVVAGVSGSGKSTLVRQVMLPAVREALGLVTEPAGEHRELLGAELVQRAVAVDQSPIGRTPRSVPATFLGIWDTLRRIFAASPEAKVAGFDAARFSFNTPRGGRCPACEGQGVTTHEMSFLPDVTTPCAVCEGARFEPQTLSVRYLGMNVGELLQATAEQAAALFVNHPEIASPLRTLVDLGAGYIRLGQGSHTLSGGEAQRLKLAAELTASVRHQPTLYVLDEPTTGLHLADVEKLVQVLDRLVERGDTLIVIEHHPEVIAGADWILELGPEGGAGGGRVVARGAPRDVAKKRTATAAVLQRFAALKAR
ncbi:MAG: excinuclease ABC subunit UvrA [Polyangiaceae bacterium]